MPRVKQFIESGDLAKANKYADMAYLMMSVAIGYQEDCNHLMRKHGFEVHDVKYLTNRLSKCFDQVNAAYKRLFVTQEGKEHLCLDFMKFQYVCDKFMNSATEDDFVHVNLKTGRVVKQPTDNTVTCLKLETMEVQE